MKSIISTFILLLSLIVTPLIAQNFAINHGPYLQAVGKNEVTIVWTTNNPAISWVEVASAGDESFYAKEHPKYFEISNGKRLVSKLHRINIAGLTKNTEYRYRIFSKEVISDKNNKVIYGNVVSSDVFNKAPLRFKTFDDEKDKISFTVVNDIHAQNDTLKALLKEIRYGKTDMVVFNGDMISSVENEEEIFNGFMKSSISMFAKEVPMFYVRGNHETRGGFSTQFPDYFVNNSGKPYYAFRYGPAYFIVLDSGEDKPDSDIEYADLACFDKYRTEQQHWLSNILNSTECQSTKYKIVFMHIPPFGTDWHGEREVKTKFLPILNKAGIDIMFCGHTHKYSYIDSVSGVSDFPVLVNGANTSLDVTVNTNSLIIKIKNTKGNILNTHEISK